MGKLQIPPQGDIITEIGITKDNNINDEGIEGYMTSRLFLKAVIVAPI